MCAVKIHKISKFDLAYTYPKQFYYLDDTDTFRIPSYIKKISKQTFYSSNLKSLTIPARVSVIEAGAFSYMKYLKTMYFNQPAEMNVSLPASGMVYSKDAKEMTIYTDNEIIKNYNWAGDNITATIYHLDGTEWEA